MKKILILLLFVSIARSQEIRDRNIEIGIYGILGQANHTAELIDDDIDELDYCCPAFENGSGFAWELGLLFEYPLSKYFAVSTRVSLRDISGTLEFVESLDEVNVNGVPQIGQSTHYLENDLLSAGIALFFDYEPIYHLNLSTGFRFATLMTSDFNYYERVTKPNNAIFKEEGTKNRNQQSGEFLNTSSYLSLELALSYSISLDEIDKNLITPQIYYSYGLSDLISDAPWRVNFIGFGIAYQFNIIRSSSKTSSPISPN
jgi:hypothetical protein